MTEHEIMAEIQLAASEIDGCRLFRNQVGGYHTPDGRYVRSGLCVGSADLIGWYHGRFLAVEVKTPKGKPTEQQKAFIRSVNDAGGIGMIVRSVDEFIEGVK